MGQALGCFSVKGGKSVGMKASLRVLRRVANLCRLIYQSEVKGEGAGAKAWPAVNIGQSPALEVREVSQSEPGTTAKPQ